MTSWTIFIWLACFCRYWKKLCWFNHYILFKCCTSKLSEWDYSFSPCLNEAFGFFKDSTARELLVELLLILALLGVHLSSNKSLRKADPLIVNAIHNCCITTSKYCRLINESCQWKTNLDAPSSGMSTYWKGREFGSRYHVFF